MDEPCLTCRNVMAAHNLDYRANAFLLACPDMSLHRPVGATFDIASDILTYRYGSYLADKFLAPFTPPTVGQQLFRLDNVTHTPGGDCAACAPGWPVRCSDHGGDCQGHLHTTLRHARRDKVYSQRSELPTDKLHPAYWNLNEPRRNRFPTPYRALSSCHHCSSAPSRREVERACLQL